MQAPSLGSCAAMPTACCVQGLLLWIAGINARVFGGVEANGHLSGVHFGKEAQLLPSLA